MVLMGKVVKFGFLDLIINVIKRVSPVTHERLSQETFPWDHQHVKYTSEGEEATEDMSW